MLFVNFLFGVVKHGLACSFKDSFSHKVEGKVVIEVDSVEVLMFSLGPDCTF